MLAELFEYCITPCTRRARALGYLKEAAAIRARHARLREQWRGHLENSRRAILDAARACPGRGWALVAGSGALLDIPLEELSALFGQVVLADMVHPVNARLRARRLGNVRLETVDVTGITDRLDSLSSADAFDATGHAISELFPGFIPDFTVSANLLSQLPLLPCAALARRGWDQAGQDGLARALIAAHLAWLRGLSGSWCLVADTAWITGQERADPLYGLAPPDPWRSWHWAIAPRPEIYADRDVFHEVSAWRGPRQAPD